MAVLEKYPKKASLNESLFDTKNCAFKYICISVVMDKSEWERERAIGKDGLEGGESVLLNDAWRPKREGGGGGLRIYGEK